MRRKIRGRKKTVRTRPRPKPQRRHVRQGRKTSLQQSPNGKLHRLNGAKRPKSIVPISDPKLEKSYRLLRSGLSQRSAAKEAGVSVSRFRRFIQKNKLAKYQGRRWKFSDRRYREIRAITTEGEKTFFVRGFKAASTAMSHRNAVRQFLATNDLSLLTPFENVSVIDTHGHAHKLETRPNILYRLAATDSDQFISVYRLVA